MIWWPLVRLLRLLFRPAAYTDEMHARNLAALEDEFERDLARAREARNTPW